MENSLILVAMVSPNTAPVTFKKKRLEWPLHVTIAPWFFVEDEAGFTDFLTRNLPSESAFEAVVGREDQFGPNNDIPVNVIENYAPFAKLHHYVLTAITAHGGGFVQSTFVGQNYRPHVTQHQDRVHESDSFMVTELALVKLLSDDVCEVIERIPLQVQA